MGMFRDSWERQIIELILLGYTNSEIKERVGFNSRANKVNFYRCALREGNDRYTKVAAKILRDRMAVYEGVGEELRAKLNDASTGELTALVAAFCLGIGMKGSNLTDPMLNSKSHEEA